MCNNLDCCERHPAVPNWNALANELRSNAELSPYGRSSNQNEYIQILSVRDFARKLCEEYGIPYSKT